MTVNPGKKSFLRTDDDKTVYTRPNYLRPQDIPSGIVVEFQFYNRSSGSSFLIRIISGRVHRKLSPISRKEIVQTCFMSTGSRPRVCARCCERIPVNCKFIDRKHGMLPFRFTHHVDNNLSKMIILIRGKYLYDKNSLCVLYLDQ